ncbi:hypothetical protein D3C84_1055980 [compost metagenome]
MLVPGAFGFPGAEILPAPVTLSDSVPVAPVEFVPVVFGPLFIFVVSAEAVSTGVFLVSISSLYPSLLFLHENRNPVISITKAIFNFNSVFIILFFCS